MQSGLSASCCERVAAVCREWREDVKEYKAVMDLEPDDEVESSWLRLFTFFNAVTAAEENLHQMLAY